MSEKENADNQGKNKVEKHKTGREKQIAAILPFMWKKGQSGNPAGRTKGKTMKEYAKELLACQTEEERQEFLHGLPKDVIWKMAEGNPESKVDLKTEETPYDKLTKSELRARLQSAVEDLRENEEPTKSDIPNGNSISLPKDGKNTPGSGAISNKSEERPAQGNPATAERPPENNGGNDKLDTSTISK